MLRVRDLKFSVWDLMRGVRDLMRGVRNLMLRVRNLMLRVRLAGPRTRGPGSRPALDDPPITEVAPFNLAASAVTSVDVCDGIVAFAVPNDPETDNGSVVLTEADGTLIQVVTVGALPDMVTFTHDCAKVLSANEGEPDDNVDPERSVSIVDVASGAVETATFTHLNGQVRTATERWMNVGIPATPRPGRYADSMPARCYRCRLGSTTAAMAGIADGPMDEGRPPDPPAAPPAPTPRSPDLQQVHDVRLAIERIAQ